LLPGVEACATKLACPVSASLMASAPFVVRFGEDAS
jgi:hypothetical protein